MFENLSDKLESAFKKLRGHGKLTEDNIEEGLREVRMALLEADVHFRVVKSFIEEIRARSLGQEVMGSLTPAQQVVKIVNEKLTAPDGLAARGPGPLRRAAGGGDAGRPARLRQNHHGGQARGASAEKGAPAPARAGGRLPSGGHRSAQEGRRAGGGAGLSLDPGPGPGRRSAWRPRRTPSARAATRWCWTPPGGCTSTRS